jgi:hypothetical protein
MVQYCQDDKQDHIKMIHAHVNQDGKNSVLLKIIFDYGEKRKWERSDPEGGRWPTAFTVSFGSMRC